MKKKNKGITLISLVVTIIVLLVLAGVTIVMLKGDNGVITKAQIAKVENEKAKEIEGIKLAYQAAILNETYTLDKGILYDELLKIDVFSSLMDERTESIISGKEVINKYELPWKVIMKSTRTYSIDERGNIIENGIEEIDTNTYKEVYHVLYTDGTLTISHDNTKLADKEVKAECCYDNEVWGPPSYREDIINVIVLNKVCAKKIEFGSCTNLETITGFEKIDTNDLGSISFYNCNKLVDVNLSKLKTSKLTSMSNMFNGCNSLTTIDVSGFQTENVTSMGYMFNGCSSLTMIDVSGFETGNVTYMYSMFNGCNSLTTIDVSKFNTEKVTNIGDMFGNCSNLINLDVSNFNLSSLSSLYSMFENCESLTSLDLSEWDTSGVSDMRCLFSGCSSLTNLNISGFNTSNVRYIEGMFYYCKSLTHIDVSSFNTSKVTSMANMFTGCSALADIDVSSFDVTGVKKFYQMFRGCEGLKEIDLSSWTSAENINMGGMFYSCKQLENIKFNSEHVYHVTSLDECFAICYALKNLNLTMFETSSISSGGGYHIFYCCKSLEQILVKRDLWTIESVKGQFDSCAVDKYTYYGEEISNNT